MFCFEVETVLTARGENPYAGIPSSLCPAFDGKTAHWDPAPEVTVKNIFLKSIISFGFYKLSGLGVCVSGWLVVLL